MFQIRQVNFAPYATGPRFCLRMWDTGRCDHRGVSIIRYRLNQDGKTIFEGEDFAGSPMDADDSDATVRNLMGFLTLRPGDTDSEYFANYTPLQMEFCDLHAEALSFEVFARFGS